MAATKRVVEIEIDVDSDGVKQLNKDLDKTEEATQDVKKGAKGMGGAFKAVGAAIKAAGIGLLIAIVGKVGEVFSKNQKFIDAFAIATDTASIVIKDVGDALVRVYDTVTSSSENFDALGKILSGIITLVLTPLKVQWYALQAGIVSAQLAWEQSFFGGKDPERIKELKAELNDIGESLNGVAVAAGESAMDIYNNFSEAVGEVGGIATTAMEELSHVSISAAIEQAKYITEIGKAAELAEIRQQGLIEKYDREAELLRQARDDFNLSFDERIARNEELAAVLDRQTAEELGLIEIRKKALQADRDAGLIAEHEYMLAKETLANEEAEIYARIEGFKSEVQINRQGLEKEASDARIAQAKTESDELIERLRTQDEMTVQIMEEGVDKELAVSAMKYDKLFEQAEGNKDLQLQVIEAQEREAAEIVKKSEAEKKKLREDAAEVGVKLATDGVKAFGDIADAVLGNSEANARKVFQTQKAVSLGMAIIDGFKAVNASLAYAPVVIGAAPNPAGIASLAFAAASSAATIAKIVGTKFQPNGGGGSGGISASKPNIPTNAPQFNTIGSASNNQLAESIAGQNKNPARAYVVASDVSTAQALDRNKIDTASFG